MKKVLALLLFVPLISTAQFKELLTKVSTKASTTTATGTLSTNLDISSGLKEALNKGITEQVSKLTQADGFYKNDLVKIVMPEELTKVDVALRKMGMSSLADDGIKALNRAAEDAVKEATPIFVTAITNMSITDAQGILLGADNAATSYLQTNTNTALYAKFNPVVKSSIGKVGADVVWNSIIEKYNKLPFVSKVNPDITDYVTNKALDGVFTMISVEELDIRNNLASRTTDLLKSVFALQDSK